LLVPQAVAGCAKPKCPKCGRQMASVLKREGGVTRVYYVCPTCPDTGEKQTKHNG